MFNTRRIQSNNGFTLVELLVVISIIGVLSSTVLAAVSSARVKAENAARIQTMQEYEKALQLILTDKGDYPKPDTSTFPFVCINNDTSQPCDFFFDTGGYDLALNQEFATYLPSLPQLKYIEDNSFGYNGGGGPIYTCATPGSPLAALKDCLLPGVQGVFFWSMKGDNEKCMSGYAPISLGSGTTVCWPILY